MRRKKPPLVEKVGVFSLKLSFKKCEKCEK
jgi:hypothetical protein